MVAVEMVAIPNYHAFPKFLPVIFTLLWLGVCVLAWFLLSMSPQPEILNESMRVIFSLFAPFLSVGILAALLDIWFGKRIYEVRNGWLHTEKRLFGLRRDAFDYDPELVTECSVSHVDGSTPLSGDELERLRHAGAVICRRGKMGAEYPAPGWVCRLVYDGQLLILLAGPSREPAARLAEFMETVIRTCRERRA